MIKYIIAYHTTQNIDGSVTIDNSSGESITSKDSNVLWDFLYQTKRDNSTRELKFFWNLDESLAPIFRIMSPEECKLIITTKFKDAKHFFYRRGKNLTIFGDYLIKGKNGNPDHPYRAIFYGLEPLISADTVPANAQDILEQCQRLLKALENIGITTPMTLNSAIGIYESSMRGIQLTPNIKSIPPKSIDILIYAKHCANRQGWISNFKTGHITDSFSYDVSSSYGWWLSQIRDFNNCEYIKYYPDFASKHIKDIKAGNITGYFKVELSINKEIKVHPFAYVSDSGKVIYPTGRFETYLTLEEIMAFCKYKLGTLKIIDGYYVRFLNYNKPMENIVNRLYQMRSLGDIENDLCKGIIVGYVGKTNAQFENNETSQTYNPLIAGWIYAQARLQVFKFIMDNDLVDSLISVSTDGVLSTKQANDETVSKDKIMGTWRYEGNIPALVLSPGWVIYKDKKPHSVTYDMAIETIKASPNSNHYKFTTMKPITLFEASEIHHDISKVGLVTEHYNTIDLSEIEMGQDRIFKSFPRTGKALLSGKLYNSKPIRI
jgi:hypothetical protein